MNVAGKTPMAMQSAAAMPMATSMFLGGSFVRMPESWAKKAKYGILMPACSSTPAEAKSSEQPEPLVALLQRRRS